MAQRQEIQSDKDRESVAIELWANGRWEYYKLGENDIDFKVRLKETKEIGFVEVKGRNKTVAEAFPLPIAARKLVKLDDKRKQDPKATRAFVIWACTDGLITGDLDSLRGFARMGGRPKRPNTANDWEVMVYCGAQDSPFEKVMYK